MCCTYYSLIEEQPRYLMIAMQDKDKQPPEHLA